MRIGFAHQYDVYRSDLARTQGHLFDSQRRITTGKKILGLSDDPNGATAAIGLRRLYSAAEQYEKNLTTAKGFLGMTESTLGEMTTLVNRANELAVAGANGTLDQTAREGIVREISEIQRRLVDLGNSEGPGNRRLFAGQLADVKPFNVEDNVLVYRGDTNDMSVEISATETLTITTQLGTALPQLFADLNTLKNHLQSGTTGSISGESIPAMQQATRNLTLMRSTVGTRLQTVEQSTAHHTRRMDELTAQISDVEDVDMSEAILDYKMAETAYQAALQSVSMISRLSLMDFMR